MRGMLGEKPEEKPAEDVKEEDRAKCGPEGDKKEEERAKCDPEDKRDDEEDRACGSDDKKENRSLPPVQPQQPPMDEHQQEISSIIGSLKELFH